MTRATWARTCTDDALAELARPPRDRAARLLLADQPDAALAVVDRLEVELHGQIDRYTHWISSLLGFLRDRHGAEGGALAVHATRRLFATYPQLATVDADLPMPLGPVLRDLVIGDPEAALRQLDEALVRWRDVIDLHRDWISALLSALYRAYGADALEACHRHVGQRTMRNLTAGLDAPAAERLERFVWLLHGHFSEVTLREEEERFVISQDPCGTCGRQALQGRHRAPLDLAIVDEPHLVTWGGRATTAYRTHVPVWHVAMATEQLGVPWPVNLCPSGDDDGRCDIYLYKDPQDPRAASEVPGGLAPSPRPARRAQEAP